MSNPPSDKPPPKAPRVKPEVFPFGLSPDQFAKVTREMLAVARLVCRHSGASPWDAVQQAFVKALSKPRCEQPSIQNEKKFVGYMCTLAKYEAMTIRTSHRRRALREVSSAVDIAEMVGVPPGVNAVEARRTLERAFLALKPSQQALLHALFADGKTVNEVAQEKRLRWTTVDSRLQRILDLLRAAIQATMAALVLLMPKRARAFVTHVTQQAPRVLVQATQFGGAMTMTVVCGVLVPTGSSVATEPSTQVGLAQVSSPQATLTQADPLPPSFVPEVELEEPKVLDAVTNEWSAADMKSTKIARCLLGTAVPMAFLFAPALTQVACTGTQQQALPPQDPEDDPKERAERRDSYYEGHCLQEQRRGNKCETREEWDKVNPW